MNPIKYTVKLPTALLERINDIPCPFTNRTGNDKIESVNNCVLNAFLLALTRKATGEDNYYQKVSFEERKHHSIATFRLPSWLFEMVKNKYKKLYNRQVFMYVLADALAHRASIDCLPPAFTFVGHKNEKMRKKTKMILAKKLGKENLLYVEPFCGSAALFLSLPLQPTWEYILNDWSKNKVNLLRAIKYKPLELIELVLAYEYHKDDYTGTNNETRQRLTAFVEWFEDYEFTIWLRQEQSKAIQDEKNPYKHDYKDDKRNRIIPTDNPRKEKNFFLDHAAAYLVYSAMVGRNKLSVNNFTKSLIQIPLISLKLNQAKARILWGDGIEVMKKYADTSKVNVYKTHKTLIVADPPYISSEEQCDKNNFAKRHQEMINLLHRVKKHCYWLYFCRSSSPLRFKDEEREVKDTTLQGKIDDFFRGRGYYSEEYLLSERDDQPIAEFMITNFRHYKSKPYE
jgi:site-specific DNA-adenine methylase